MATAVRKSPKERAKRISKIGLSVARSMPKKRGLYANIQAKRKRIAAGSGEKMRKPGAKGAPTAANFKAAAKTAKKRKPKGKK